MLTAAALAVVAMVTASVVILFGGGDRGTAGETEGGPEAERIAADFLTAFAHRNAASASAWTDDPRAARRVLTEAVADLGATAVETGAATVRPAGDGAMTGSFTVRWTLGEGRVWTYENTLELRLTDRGWRVRWTPALIHPRLREGQRLVLRTHPGTPAAVDRDGTPLLVWRHDGPRAAPGVEAPVLLPGMARVTREHGGGNGWSVVLVDARGGERQRLTGERGGDSRPLASTLSIPVQRAAQAAVDGAGAPAMLVAIQPSTGELLAVAQSTEAGAAPGALTGLYAPGSTFKIATATAVLEHGVAAPDTVLPCPGTARIGTRTIPNDDRFDLGAVPLHTAFAHSCNTTFARLAADLPHDALATAASQLGLNADFTIPGITTEAGKVEAAADPVRRLEDGIGQGRVQASPFGVALMAATVARGAPVTPTLWRDVETTVGTGYQAPSPAVLDAVRAMMRETVTSGTAQALAGLGEVHGKTGTAQLPDRTQAHGWFAGYRGDLAFAVLVQGAGSSRPAVDAGAAFLAAVS
ncbi:penicillin-binding protein [Prauserella muralis]|uniref:Penicillin-binding protein n=1 Tax=Prauserella muralis TaxID=588067 RepID=A0A2V4ARK3_9PSEU|nr:penicillin-binding protein [Prauserella muralis]